MAVLTVCTSERDTNGATWAPVAAAGGGDSFANTGRESVLVKNAGVGSITVTFAHQGQIDPSGANLAVPDLVVTVPNSGEGIWTGPFPTDQYNDANNRVNITYSGVSSVTVGVLKIPGP